MPWRGIEAEQTETGLKYPTLGLTIAAWIEAYCVVPDGDHQNEPYKLTNEMLRFLLEFYRLEPDGTSTKYDGPRFHYSRGGQLVRPQKWGKGPFSAAIICAEAWGPVLPAGWNAKGEPVGRQWPTPLVQVTAISEEQVNNVWRVLKPMIDNGPLGGEIPDTGETRINLPGGGRIEPVTASARSRLGQRVTAVVQDETHSWLERSQGVRLADNQRRNLSGMGGRFLETTNAWDPTEQSVAQLTNESPVGVLVDFPPPLMGSVRNKRDRRKAMKQAYGDSWWVDLDRIDTEIEALILRDPAQAERFFLNRIHAGESVAFDPVAWANNARPDLVIPDRSIITIGVDGARFDDALAIIATSIDPFHQWPLCILERPGSAGDDYEHDMDEADGAVIEAFERWDVWRLYCDPQYIETLIDRWQGRWTEKVVVPWYTARPRQVAHAVRTYRVAISTGEMTNDGSSVFNRHIHNSRRYPLNIRDEDGRPMWSLRKDRPHSPNKIDAAMAGVISAEARSDAIAAGVLNQPVKARWFAGL